MLGRLSLVLLLLTVPSSLQAAWSFNLGYHNPLFSRYGLNFMNAGQRFAFEIGLGALSLDGHNNKNQAEKTSDSNDSSDLDVSGAASLKWLLATGGFRPYLQAGMGLALRGSLGRDSGAGASTSEWFAGGGLLLQASSWYLYLSYNLSEGDQTIGQAGLGFML